MKAAWLIVVIVVAGCSGVKLPNNQTADARFAALHGGGDRQIAHDFYELGAGDAIKRLYWAQRRVQETGSTTDAQPTRLQRKYVVLPVPEHVEPDGTIKEANNQVVEVVQLLAVTLSHGRNLFIVK